MNKEEFKNELEKWWNEHDDIVEHGAAVQHLVERVEDLENRLEELLPE